MSAPPRLLVTGPEGQSDRLCVRLRENGIEPVKVPAIAIEPPESYEDLDRAIAELERYEWILVTSRNAVTAMFDRIAVVAAGRTLPRLHFAAIGPGTDESLRLRGVSDVWIPSRYLSEVMGAELPAVAGDRVLRIRSEIGSRAPAELLRARGVEVHEVVAYRIIEAPPASRQSLRDAVEEGLDGVLFTSASTVRGLLRLADVTGLRDTLTQLPIVVIGPVTASAVEAAGLRAHIVADMHSVDGIVNVLRERGFSHADVTPA
ncbi:MAG: uroporphyrinogen-III synthase [bacterium]